LLVTTFKILQLLEDIVPRNPTGAPPLDHPAGGLPSPDPLWFCPRPKPTSAAFVEQSPGAFSVEVTAHVFDVGHRRCPQPQSGMRHLLNAYEVEAGTV